MRIQVIGIFILLLIAPIVAWAQAANVEAAGKVIITAGFLQAMSVENKSRMLQRGDVFYNNETLITNANSTAQVRFSDGTVMALNPDAQIKIDAYSYQKNPKTDKNIVTLVRGGFRTLTGAISKKNPDAYRVNTPTAVIGVRGTIFSVVLDASGQLYSGVSKGNIVVKNNKGSVELGQGKDYSYVFVASQNEAPVGLLNPPKQLVHSGCSGSNDNARRTNF